VPPCPQALIKHEPSVLPKLVAAPSVVTNIVQEVRRLDAQSVANGGRRSVPALLLQHWPAFV
jgi:hypothetical protein